MAGFSANCQSLLSPARIFLILLFCVGTIRVFHGDETSKAQIFTQRSSDPFQRIRQKLAAAYSLQGDYNFTLAPLTPYSEPHLLSSSPQTSSIAAADIEKGPTKPLTAVINAPILNFTFTIFNSKFCDLWKDKFLLVIVHSAPSHFYNRQLIRQTWANSVWREKQNFGLFFLLGASISEPIQEKIKKESAEFGDVVQYTHLDTYRNLTYKNLAGLSFLSTIQCDLPFKYILKTDDDMFVYIRPVVAFLRQEIKCQRSLVRTIFCAEFLRKEVVQRGKASKWYIPWEAYGEKHYPPYCYGGGYILSQDLVELLREAAKRVSYYWIDDVFVTGLAARKITGGVRHLQLPKQNPIKSYTCSPACMKKNHKWFMHTLQKVDMLRIYFRVLQGEGGQVDEVSADNCIAPATVSARKTKKRLI